MRQQLEGANHMEPSTIHGYRKVYQKHVEGKPIKAMQINRITAKDGQDWLNSLPQSLSHKTHLRARAFLSGVFTRDIGEVSEGPKLPSGGRWLDVLRVEREEAH